DALRALFIEIGDRHVGPFASKHSSDLGSEPGSAAGYQRDFVLKSHVPLPLCSSVHGARLSKSPHATSDEINHASESSNLFRRCVVERRALVDDVDGDDFQWLVADDLEARMRHVAQIDRARAGRELDLLAVGHFDRRAFKHVKGFLAVMDMARDYFAG